MEVQIFKPENIDVSRISYSTPYPKKGGRIVYINYINDDSEKVNFVIKTPIMNNPFGLNTSSSWSSVNLQFTPNQKSLKNAIDSIDDKLIYDIDRFSYKWKTDEKEYKHSIYTSQNDCNAKDENNKIINNCNNFMRANIYKDSDGKYDVSLFDTNHNLLDIGAITSGCRLSSILELVGIFISDTNNTISPQWRLYQAVVYPSNNIIRGKCIIDSDSD
jgi:hypothetical protein